MKLRKYEFRAACAAALLIFLSGCFSDGSKTSLLRIENSSGSSFSITIADYSYGTLADKEITSYQEFNAGILLQISINGTATGSSVILEGGRYSTLKIYDPAFVDSDDFFIGED